MELIMNIAGHINVPSITTAAQTGHHDLVGFDLAMTWTGHTNGVSAFTPSNLIFS
jgi:hypothetical protein